MGETKRDKSIPVLKPVNTVKKRGGGIRREDEVSTGWTALREMWLKDEVKVGEAVMQSWGQRAHKRSQNQGHKWYFPVKLQWGSAEVTLFLLLLKSRALLMSKLF